MDRERSRDAALAARTKVAAGYATAIEAVEGMVRSVGSCRAALEQAGCSEASAAKRQVADLEKAMRAAQTVNKVKAANKAIHGALGRLGKALEATTGPKLEAVFDQAVTKKPQVMEAHEVDADTDLCEAIALHLLFEGEIDIARLVLPSLDAQTARFFEEFHAINEELDQEPASISTRAAIAWAGRNRAALERAESSLEFHLHKFAFLQLASSGDTAGAVEYARTNLAAFAADRANEIRTLMGTLVFADPHALEVQAEHVRRVFREDSTFIRGLPSRSPLCTAVAAGRATLTKLEKYLAVLAMTRAGSRGEDDMLDDDEDEDAVAEGESGQDSLRGPNWVDLPELPVDVPLAADMAFHSVFVCPVSKQPTTGDNQPVLLLCGHVIASESLQRIAKSGGRLKCPTCLADQSMLLRSAPKTVIF